jgi:hypothetical protein
MRVVRILPWNADVRVNLYSLSPWWLRGQRYRQCNFLYQKNKMMLHFVLKGITTLLTWDRIVVNRL